MCLHVCVCVLLHYSLPHRLQMLKGEVFRLSNDPFPYCILFLLVHFVWSEGACFTIRLLHTDLHTEQLFLFFFLYTSVHVDRKLKCAVTIAHFPAIILWSDHICVLAVLACRDRFLVLVHNFSSLCCTLVLFLLFFQFYRFKFVN